MSDEKRLLLEGAYKSAPELTHGLAVYGNGRMSDGLMALWKDGQRNGIVRGTIVSAVVFAAGVGIYNWIAELRTKRAIQSAFDQPQTSGSTCDSDSIIEEINCQEEIDAFTDVTEMEQQNAITKSEVM